MKTLFKHLAKSWYLIIFVISLLVVQAVCELALPEYTSKIVNVGIQQKGIDNYVPTEIRQDEMYMLLMMVSNGEDKEFVLSNYTASEENNEILLLNNISKDEQEVIYGKIEDILGTPMVVVFAMQNMSTDSDIAMDFSSFAAEMGTELPEGYVPDFTDPMIIGKISEKLSELDSSIISQIAMQYVSGEYEAIGVDLEKKQMDYMTGIGGIMIFYAFAAMVCTIIVSFLSSRIAGQFAKNARSSLFNKIMQFSSHEFDSFSTASLITRSTNDIQQVQMVITMALRILIFAPIMGFGALYKVLRDGSSMGWIIGLAVGVILLLIIFLFVVALPKFQVIQKMVDKINLVSREILTGLPVIRAFSKEEHERKRFDNANKDLTKVNLFVNRVMSIMMPTMMFIMNGISVLIIWVGSDAVNGGTMQVGDLMAFITYTMQIIMSFLMLSMMSIILPRSIISFKRIGEVLSTEISVCDPEKPVKFDNDKTGCIEFRNVSFHYQNAEEDVLKNISFSTKAGQTTAIIGSTGSGKSTLANLIPRFFDVTGGEILLDGVNIKNVTLHDLREKIGYIPQKAVLFSGTIKSNIAYSAINHEMSEEQVKLAAEISQSEEFISGKEEGFESAISQGGTNVSGGQKQRLSIARAVAKNPEIYIFDDSFSALDFKTDIALRKALSKTTARSAVIIVAQRISTILNADQIIVLDEGQIAGIGTHKVLLDSCEVYRDIAYSQLSAEELGRKEEA